VSSSSRGEETRDRPGAAARPADRPHAAQAAPRKWHAVLEALLLDDSEVLERLAARGAAGGVDRVE